MEVTSFISLLSSLLNAFSNVTAIVASLVIILIVALYFLISSYYPCLNANKLDHIMHDLKKTVEDCRTNEVHLSLREDDTEAYIKRNTRPSKSKQADVTCQGGDLNKGPFFVTYPDSPQAYDDWIATTASNPNVTSFSTEEIWSLLRDASAKELRVIADQLENAFNHLKDHPRNSSHQGFTDNRIGVGLKIRIDTISTLYKNNNTMDYNDSQNSSPELKKRTGDGNLECQ
ncbi:hypothetical protein K435DRAFT_879410 [Dendrothele bispora CBS 962.96]|uniref:Uncharacterized protein n=1 Tax=Dendrothele bispora (strain CBS 962.96) TaxID=1314807 RepID=A0A4S8KM62_DENBC|nr:hypothetical protein K435DRAFT_879410 [Dendrothele bispora CBS 962.96]